MTSTTPLACGGEFPEFDKLSVFVLRFTSCVMERTSCFVGETRRSVAVRSRRPINEGEEEGVVLDDDDDELEVRNED